uniref:PilZ domain-containing protein n=1 Tax=Paractinoplanes polyasparticus TaxID=2856853 RepID=UPI001C845207|nr:PilZ domain-containing protein [Actinoplanes polyasparticus]
MNNVLELPKVGTPLFLVASDGVSLPSRLESVDGEAFSVSRPAGLTGTLSAGQELDIFWASPRSRLVLSCRVVAGPDPERWTFVSLASPRPDNRRQFVRGGAGAAVRLTTRAGDEPAAGALLDISEGGLRCWIDPSVTFTPGQRLTAALWLGTAEAELDAEVHAVREARNGDPGRHLVLTFTTEGETAQLIRQYVAAWELGERRRAADGQEVDHSRMGRL